MIWEKMDRGRYATEYNGHVLQALRRDGPHVPDQRPYVAIVDRVPVADGWSLAQAKTRAIQHVERQHTKSKAERVFQPKPAAPPEIPDPVDAMLMYPPSPLGGDLDTAALVEVKEPEPEPDLSPIPVPERAPEPDTALNVAMAQLGTPLQVAITGRLADSGDLLDTLNALRSALELLREHAELECHVNLPPTIKL